jgi:ribosome-associated protein
MEPKPQKKFRLDQFLKLRGVVPTGGQAKLLIQGGEVRVNGEVETRRGRGLQAGDRIEVEGRSYLVEADLFIDRAGHPSSPDASL